MNEQNEQLNSGVVNGGNSFLTQCFVCNIRYEYYNEVQDRVLRCQNCSMPLVALNQDQSTQPRAKLSKARKARRSQKGSGNMHRKQEQQSQPSKRANDKRRKNFIQDGLEVQSDTLRAQQFDNAGDSHTRRSSRNKRRVTYNEYASDDDDETMNPPKRAKGSEETKSGASEEEQPSSVITPEPTFHEYPDPEFCDFDKDREEHCFKGGQVWAVYDTVDAMPRLYALIKKVFSSGFKLEIIWLEPAPNNQDALKWAEFGLPFSCGNFKFGNSESTEDRLMFSHEIFWDTGDFIKIYPKKGETWALFKNWDAKWYGTPENERKFEYEFVEVASEYDETVGIRVVQLGKLKGFASLFCRESGNDVQIPPTEVLRFSHRVPAYKMTGNERQDVPKGSFELDPASLGLKVEEITLPNTDGQTRGETVFEPMEKGFEAANGDEGNSNPEITPEPTFREYPGPEFCDFDKDREEHCFKVGQVWALYDTVDAMPRFYALIKKVFSSGFKLKIIWLEPAPNNQDGLKCAEYGLPFSCGNFKFGNSESTEDRLIFSHEIFWDTGGSSDFIKIYPKKGETWALFKNWDAKWYGTPENERKFEYEFVEVTSEFDETVGIRVVQLGKLKGFVSLFCRESGNEVQIRPTEVLRFSHRVPAYKMNGNERQDVPKGSFELDPASLDPASLGLKVEEISLPNTDGQTRVIESSK